MRTKRQPQSLQQWLEKLNAGRREMNGARGRELTRWATAKCRRMKLSRTLDITQLVELLSNRGNTEGICANNMARIEREKRKLKNDHAMGEGIMYALIDEQGNIIHSVGKAVQVAG